MISERMLLALTTMSLVVSVTGKTTAKPDYGKPDGPQDPKCPRNAYFRECTNECPPKSCDNIMEVSGPRREG